MSKNRNRRKPTFANINLLGVCNARCYFCLGEDIPEYLGQYNQLKTYYSYWKDFRRFLTICKRDNIENIYITGQNTDALLYKYLEELIHYLQVDWQFNVGLRTNGYHAIDMMDTINTCKRNIGYSIHSFDPSTNKKIMGRDDIPNWHYILMHTKHCRVSIVVNRYNRGRVFSILSHIGGYPSIEYIQLRKVSTDTRKDQLQEDQDAYEDLKHVIDTNFPKTYEYYGAQAYHMYGKDVLLWATVETDVNSHNYFTDGTISTEYFIVEGYLSNRDMVRYRTKETLGYE